MKKLAFVIGLGLGFILGSRAGSGPYRDLKDKVRAFRNRAEVDEVVERAKEAANVKVTEAAETVNEKLPPLSKTVRV